MENLLFSFVKKIWEGAEDKDYWTSVHPEAFEEYHEYIHEREFKIEGLRFGVEVEAALSDIETVAGLCKAEGIRFWLERDGSLAWDEEEEYYEGEIILEPVSFRTLVRIIKTIWRCFERNPFRCGIHVHINVSDKPYSVVRYAVRRLQRTMKVRVKEMKSDLPYIRDENDYSSWQREDRYNVLNFTGDTVEFRGMGLHKLLDMNEEGVIKYLASILAVGLYVRRFNTIKDVARWWRLKYEAIGRETWWLLTPKEMWEYLMFGITPNKQPHYILLEKYLGVTVEKYKDILQKIGGISLYTVTPVETYYFDLKTRTKTITSIRVVDLEYEPEQFRKPILVDINQARKVREEVKIFLKILEETEYIA